MKREIAEMTIPKWSKLVLTISLIFYIWYFASTLILPLSEFTNIPEGVFMTLYKLASFPPSLLGFVICISMISTILVLLQFKERRTFTKMLLTDGVSFVLYFIIPILATLALLAIIVLGLATSLPTESRISYFLEDLFLFTSALFVLTAILNIATQRILMHGR